MSPALRRDEAQARRRTNRTPKRENPVGDEAMDIVRRAQNAMVDIDRLGRMAHINREMSREFGGGWQRGPHAELISWVIADYKDKRAKSRNPLRKKRGARVKEAPVVGHLIPVVKQVFRNLGVNPKNVLHARVRRRKDGGYAVRYTHLEPKRPLDDLKRLSRPKRCIHDLGLTMTPNGLDVVDTRADGKKDLILHVAVEHVITPGFARDFFRHMVLGRANTVALDETFVPSLPGQLRNANAMLRRELRHGQAVGANRFAVVSPVSEEIKDALPFAKRAGVSRNTLRLMKVLSVQQCPCGAPVELRLDPVTLIPVLRRTKCVECGALMDTGHVLATRASAYLLDNWRTHGNAGVLTKRI